MKQNDVQNLPKGWETKMLKEIGVTQTGTTPKTTDKSNYGDFIPFIKPADIDVYKDGEIRYSNEGLSREGLQTGRKVPEGSILMVCIGATIGKVGFVDRDVSCNQQINALTVKKEFHPKFIYYALSTPSFQGLVLKNSAQATLPIINKSKWECLPIQVPKSLPEQQRIVALLDEAFAAIARAKANAEQNLKNAKELFESYLQGVFENKGEGWEEKRFDEICVLQRGFDLPTHSRNEGKHPLVSSNGITDRINLWKVKAPGVVTGRSGTIGNVHFIDEDYWPLNTALYIKEFHGNYERFIYFFLKQFDLGKYSSGAGVPTLNRNNVHSEFVWFPKSINEQKKIVQNLDALSAETQKLEAIYQQKIADLEELKKSILQKAFNGELNTATVVL